MCLTWKVGEGRGWRRLNRRVIRVQRGRVFVEEIRRKGEIDSKDRKGSISFVMSDVFRVCETKQYPRPLCSTCSRSSSEPLEFKTRNRNENLSLDTEGIT